MTKLKKIRKWINKNDGKYFQIENQKFNFFQSFGFMLIVLSLVVYLFHEKAGFQYTWVGWLLFISGFAVSIIGFLKMVNNEKNT